MAEYRFQLAFHNGQTNLPEDDLINTLYYEVNAPDTIAGACADIASAYWLEIGPRMYDTIGSLTIKVYEMAGGAPVHVFEDPGFSPAGVSGPQEVALCLSYSATDDEAGTPRRRGRIYLPVFENAFRPTATLLDKVLDLGEALAQVGSASNTTWKLRSATENATFKIESISCDDSWDTQRRRGLKPTARERRDVQ